ncbi:hypothetical protein [Paenibacillus arenosi]|uniref:DUF4375 domain-containing protein n=1 Tax=Paenibacillus arenosi TaxID=2774142 RepID=A0ABR9B0B2_9BACL|nr:hypothetical protein [Paenibacillus arenosi]MBD8499339.1 hypothetical protein [Paenibacillus arenosi]
MGVNFSAVFRNTLSSEDMYQLCDDLNQGSKFPTLQKFSEEIVKNNPHLNTIWKWSYFSYEHSVTNTIEEKLEADGYIELDGPGGFDLLFNRHIVELSSATRWLSFLSDLEHRNEMRMICYEIASYMGEIQAIYMGDKYCATDYVFDGNTMEEYKESLMKRFGSSKKTIDDLYIDLGDCWDSIGYFEDRFHDFEMIHKAGK